MRTRLSIRSGKRRKKAVIARRKAKIRRGPKLKATAPARQATPMTRIIVNFGSIIFSFSRRAFLRFVKHYKGSFVPGLLLLGVD
jgi:hypothetical protein